MENRTGTYLNFVLTVIAVLLVGLLLRSPLGLESSAQAQPERRLAAAPEALVAQGLQSIATGVREVADSLREVARSNERVASAIREIRVEIPETVVQVEDAP